MKKIFGKLFAAGIALICVFWFAPQMALAADLIDVSFGAGFPIHGTSLAPGDIVKRNFTVTKKDNQKQTIMLKFEKTTPPASHLLAKKIFVLIKRLSDGKFLKMANGRKRQTLWSLYNYHDSTSSDAFKLDEIVGSRRSQATYELWFTFSPSAGNEFQNRSTKFDISVGVFSQPSCSCRFGCGKCDLGFWEKCWQWGKRFI